MGKRPLCLVCILLMIVLCLADGLGISLVRGNPLPRSLQAWLETHPDAVICGEVQQCAETEYSQSVYLKNVSLLLKSEGAEKSEKISIENVRVFLKNNKENAMEKIPAGTLLKVSGRLVRVPETRNPGEFDSRQYYACRHIYYFLKDGVIEEKSESFSVYLQGLEDVRECFVNVFENTSGADAPVFEAMLLGEKGNLEEETKMRYQMAGMIHILAISGMHISLLGEGVNRFLKKAGLGLFASGMLALGLMLQYGMMTGTSVAAMRAVCMFLMSVGAQLLGRCYDSLSALGLSAVILLLSAPANLYSSGFLLSFGAVLGIRAGAALVKMTGIKNKILTALLSSAAVQLVTMPVLLYFYGEVSMAGIFLNLLVLPTVGLVLLTGAAGGLIGLFSLKAAAVTLISGRALLWLYDFCCKLAGKLPVCTWIGGKPEIWQMIIYYVLLLMVFFVGKKDGSAVRIFRKIQEKGKASGRDKVHGECFGQENDNRRYKYILCVLLMCTAVLILGWRDRKGLKITCLDVGQGDAIVLETEEGYHFLVDGGSSNKTKVGQKQILPFLKNRGISKLDGILISHTDQDHISGIQELLELMAEDLTGIRADKLILPKWTQKNEAYEELEKTALRSGVKPVYAGHGDIIQAGRLELAFLAPVINEEQKEEPDVNENGIVCEVRYGDFRGLLTGDIGMETEKKLLPYLSDIDFLKVAHHGSRYSTGAEFLQKVRPEIGVISCSSSNTYGHPSDETIERLKMAGCRVEYTMKNGAIQCRTDGTKICVTEWLQNKEK
ncbi:DNA internalization-related competence protein ComEC/Rec2 [Blautia sp. HCP3S3_G3]|uniref:DNA internalization-related competence protein ComEC/Rec2 n=1 Tax=Blautia sp. HCP3S3_G3 TaxID=3438913 RepID=UPI003F88DFA9